LTVVPSRLTLLRLRVLGTECLREWDRMFTHVRPPNEILHCWLVVRWTRRMQLYVE